MTEDTALLDEMRTEVGVEVGRLEAAAIAGDADAADALLDLGSELAESDLHRVLDIVVEALDRLDVVGRLTDVERGWRHTLVGLGALADGKLDRAEQEFQAALSLAEGQDSALAANSLLNLGNVAWNRNDYKEALQLLLKGLEVASEQPLVQRRLQISLAGVYLSMDDLSNGAEVVDALTASVGAEGDPRRPALLGLQGLLAAMEHRLHDADRLLSQSATAARNAGEYAHEVTALQNLAAVNLDLGRVGPALRRLRRAERMALALGMYRVLDAVQRTLATALHRAGRRRDSRDVLARALSGARDREDSLAIARIEADQGALEVLSGRAEMAIPILKRAFDAFVAGSETDWGVLVAGNLVRANIGMGSFVSAQRVIRTATRKFDLPARERAELWELNGRLLLDRGRLNQAAQAFETAIAERMGSEQLNESDLYAAFAAEFAEADAHPEALKFFRIALKRYDPETAATARYQLLNDRALSMLATGRQRGARTDLEDALVAATVADDGVMQALILRNLSEVERRAERFDVAYDYAVRSVEATTPFDPDRSESTATRGLAELALLRFDDAEASFRDVLAQSLRERSPSIAAVALGGLAAVAFSRRDYQGASRLYRRAARIERSMGDANHEAESLAALLEVDARLNRRRAFMKDIQRMIDVVQHEAAPLETALLGTSRSGGAWLEAANEDMAAEAFASGILLALVEGGEPTSPSFLRSVGKAVVAPFIYARLYQKPVDDLQAAITSRLAKPLGRRLWFITDMFPIARDAAGVQ
jgi:tetratricopeptide (TPR) repeat protein